MNIAKITEKTNNHGLKIRMAMLSPSLDGYFNGFIYQIKTKPPADSVSVSYYGSWVEIDSIQDVIALKEFLEEYIKEYERINNENS